MCKGRVTTCRRTGRHTRAGLQRVICRPSPQKSAAPGFVSPSSLPLPSVSKWLNASSRDLVVAIGSKAGAKQVQPAADHEGTSSEEAKRSLTKQNRARALTVSRRPSIFQF